MESFIAHRISHDNSRRFLVNETDIFNKQLNFKF